MSLSQCRTALGLPEDKKILLNVGNLYDPIKGHIFFIEAIGRMVKVRKDILGIIVGSGYLEKPLRELIEELQLSPYIRLVGSKPHPEIPLWMNACDIFVLPSLNEGNPTVMFEAMGCGKPFIGTRVGGVPEVIISDAYGLLVQPADSGELAEKILSALDRKWDQAQILKYSERYTWENIAKEIMSVYRQVSG
jgi:glycosyltransferase involved in cell wall biosynthesis